MRRAKLAVPPSLAIAKAQKIVLHMNISKINLRHPGRGCQILESVEVWVKCFCMVKVLKLIRITQSY